MNEYEKLNHNKPLENCWNDEINGNRRCNKAINRSMEICLLKKHRWRYL